MPSSSLDSEVVMPFQKLASFGALGVAAGSLGLYALLAFIFRPLGHPGPPGHIGGFDTLGYTVYLIASAVPITVIALAHVAFARQLQAGVVGAES
ncbi:MAG: hypothetical protein K2X99_11520 [Gemmatimonadaceae bacterium]|nr:hypothetical protein [Gemmatimonadaceae bacterium]